MASAIDTAALFIGEQPVDLQEDGNEPLKDSFDKALGQQPEALLAGIGARFLQKANSVNSAFRSAHPAIPMVRGALLLLVISRFEAFIKDELEDLAMRATQKATCFSDLPREMRESLQHWSGEAIANPKKYRMEKRVGEIAKNISENLDGDGKIDNINHFCLSITTENMRPDAVHDLFKRLGIKDYWERISKHSELLVLFETAQEDKVKSESHKFLTELIEKRNKIAHKFQEFQWPSSDYLIYSIKFFRAIAKATSESLPVFAMHFSKPRAQAVPAKEARIPENAQPE